MSSAVALGWTLAALALFASWVLALFDAATRRDLHPATRVVLVAVLFVVVPLTFVYLLARPATAPRYLVAGRSRPGEPEDWRVALVGRLEADLRADLEVDVSADPELARRVRIGVASHLADAAPLGEHVVP